MTNTTMNTRTSLSRIVYYCRQMFDMNRFYASGNYAIKSIRL